MPTSVQCQLFRDMQFLTTSVLSADVFPIHGTSSNSFNGDNNGRIRDRMQNSGIGSHHRHATWNKYTPFPTAKSNGNGNRPTTSTTGSRDLHNDSISPSTHVVLSVPALQSASRQGEEGEHRRQGVSGRVLQQQGDDSSEHTGHGQSFQRAPARSLSVSVPSNDRAVPPGQPSSPSSLSSSLCPGVATTSTTTTQPSATYLYLYRRLPKVSSDTDYERLGRTMRGLQDGCFYYPDLDSNRARAMLQHAPEGTFLVRDSSDPRFLFALTVKTARGATSVRIQYHWGFFQLDCEEEMKRKLPRFETLLDLLDFHGTVCRSQQGAQFRWQESSRRKDMVVRLTQPRRHTPPSLAHLARVAVNSRLEDLHLPSRSTDLLPLPESLKLYLRNYPYRM